MIQARGDQDFNLAQVDQDANGGAYSKVSTFCHRIAHKIAQDAFFNKCQ
jgi:hypothetical protein